MFNWYFNNYFVENDILFITSVLIIIGIISITVHFIKKELQNKDVNK